MTARTNHLANAETSSIVRRDRVAAVRNQEALGVVARIGPAMAILLLVMAIYDGAAAPPDQRLWRILTDVVPAVILGVILLFHRRGAITAHNAGWFVVGGSLVVSAAVLATVLLSAESRFVIYLLIMVIVNGATALSTRQYVVAQTVPVVGSAAALFLVQGLVPTTALGDWLVLLLVALAASVAIHITRMHGFGEMARVLELLELQAVEDPLTGLGTRRALDETFPVLRAAAENADLYVFAVFVDVDGLKSVNDSLGHDIGDRVILALAQAMRESARSKDLLVRWGGDEFVIIGMGDVQAPARLSTSIAQRLVDLNPAPEWWVGTASSGCAHEPAADASLDRLVLAADADMYQQRVSRRNLSDLSSALRRQTDVI